jgi:hypothetical protein
MFSRIGFLERQAAQPPRRKTSGAQDSILPYKAAEPQTNEADQGVGCGSGDPPHKIFAA